ncbi:MAG: hypothetical protein QOC92_2011 [Acidimicrobiaceae bacterium]
MDVPARVFEITTDLLNARFQTLAIDGDDEFCWPLFDLAEEANPLGSRWIAPPVYIGEPTRARPDFLHLWGVPWPVVGPTVPEHLRHELLISGEYLPVVLEGATIDLLHPTTVLNVVDERSSHWTGARFDALEFDVHRFIEVTVFRVPQNNASGLYCTQGLGEFDFKSRVESADLTGLSFDEVWNSELGAIRRQPRG